MKKLELIKIIREEIKKLNEYHVEKLYDLIDDKGKIIKKIGKSIEGTGIFSMDGKEYPGGFDVRGIAWGNVVDSNGIILLPNGKKSKFKAGRHYKV